MALTKLILPPDNSSYSVTDGREVLAVQLAGGASRYRRDILGATSKVSASWLLGPEPYRYLRAFYKAVTVSGSKPFLMDLILDEPTLTEHKVYFIPESLTLTGQKGLSYSVSAQLEVYPAEMDLDAANLFASLYSELGPAWQTEFPTLEDQLNTLINIDIPGAL